MGPDVTVQRNDVDIHAALGIPGTRDARVLGCHAKRTAAGIVALGLTGAPRGLRLNESAQAVAQIDQLQQVEVGLDKRVPTADAAIGTAAAHKGGRIAGAHDDKLDISDRALTGTRVAAVHD